jgi:hypothetical protein
VAVLGCDLFIVIFREMFGGVSHEFVQIVRFSPLRRTNDLATSVDNVERCPAICSAAPEPASEY